MRSYIVKPKSVRKSQILEKDYIFSSARYNSVQINSNFDYLVNLIDVSKKSISLKNQRKYFNYVEIGSINTSTGYVESTHKKSIDISVDSVFELKKDDILISTVRTYLGGIGLVNQDDSNFVSSKALIVLRKLKKDISRYYLLGVLRSSFFIEQTNLILNASMYPRMDKDNFEHLKIPFPTTKNNPAPENVEKLVSLIVQNIIDKEEQIKAKNKLIDEKIEQELRENQKENGFSYAYPKISEIKEAGRLDTGLYERAFKNFNFLVKNYVEGGFKLEDKGYEISRGQNLQITNIGKSYYSEKKLNNKFYTLILSSNISEDSVTIGKSYLGNIRKLKCIENEDIIFCSRGAQFGRVAVFPEIEKNTITNIDNMHIKNKSANLSEKIFICQFLRYFRKIKHLYKIAIFGNGSFSFTKYHVLKLSFPDFPIHKQKEIAKLYYNILDKNNDLTFEDYLGKEKVRNKELGIFQLNMEIFRLKEILEDLVHKIVMEEKIEINMSY